MSIGKICGVAIEGGPGVDFREDYEEYSVETTLANLITACNTLDAPCTLVIPPGAHAISADTTIDAKVTVVPKPGALITVDTVDLTAVAESATDTEGIGTIAGSDTIIHFSEPQYAIKAGMYLVFGAQRKKVRSILAYNYVELWTAFAPQPETEAFSVSSATINCTGHGLEMGDVVYFGDTTPYYVSSVTSANAFVLHAHPPARITSATYTRGYRLKISGPVESGNCQWIAETGGMVKFRNSNVSVVWFGLAPGSSAGIKTKNVLAANKAAHSFYEDAWSVTTYQGTRTVEIPPGSFQFNESIILEPRSTLIGVGGSGGVFTDGTTIGGSGSHHVIKSNSGYIMYEQSKVKDLNIICADGGGAAICADNGYLTAENICVYQGTGRYNFQMQGWGGLTVKGCFFIGGTNSIFIGSDCKIIQNEIIISGADLGDPTDFFGVLINGEGNLISGNYIYRGSETADIVTWGIYCADDCGVFNNIIGNMLFNNSYGIGLEQDGGQITGNIINNNFDDGIVTAYGKFLPKDLSTLGNATAITNNKIAGNGGYGINLNDYYSNGGNITGNTFDNNTSGAINNSPALVVTPMLISDNYGHDIGGAGPIAFVANDTTPSVMVGKVFKTANTDSVKTITMFDNGLAGKEIIVIVGDAYTKFDFTGTHLKGGLPSAPGQDWTPAAGDWLEAWFDGTDWYCSCHDCTA